MPKPPPCPLCGTLVYRSHTCRVSALSRPLAAAPARPARRPARRLRSVPDEPGLVPAPRNWRERADRATEGWQERLAARRRAEGITTSLYVVEPDELTDDYSGEDLVQ